MPAILIVIPCYRERERLPQFLPELCRELAALNNVRARVVDDGSGAEQQGWLAEYVEQMRREYAFLEPAQLNTENLGKGGAIYSAWDRSEGAGLLGFVDADGAVPASEVARVVKRANEQPGKAVFAVRTGQDGTSVKRTLHRKLAGGVFRWLVRRFFRFPLPDTQCGLKLVPAADYAEIRPVLKERRFIFDVELAWHLLQRGVSIEPVPIDWTESPGSQLRPASAWQMYQSVKALRRRLGDWMKRAE
ncbi:MAG TPA: glycosyltransferase [Verrucomicrobiales bacterium]|jgi:glycosyltransferase involved in cell wall biosynthesis|nr:glycosyltransferase [Verrucomicrobiales bacterium]